MEREAGPGGLFPPVDEREGDEGADDGAEGEDGSEARATSGATPLMTKAVASAAPGSATKATAYQRGLTRNRKTRLRSSRTPLRPSARAVVTNAAMTRENADRRMNGAMPGSSRPMAPMPAVDRKGMAKIAAVAV